MLTGEHRRILLQLADRLAGDELMWAVTGSTSFALQGMELEAHDIDIQTDGPGAYRFEALLSEFVAEPVHFCGTDQIRSHFGRFLWDGMPMEVMGDVQKPEPDGSWGPPTDLKRWRRWVPLEGRLIPVLDLRYEAEAYRRIGRTARAEQLERFSIAHPALSAE